jgi:prophage regulatory protein
MAILRLPDVKKETGLRAHSTIYESIRSGLFPAPVRIGQRAVGWPAEEVQAVCNARIAGCSNEQIKALVSRMFEERVNRFAPML